MCIRAPWQKFGQKRNIFEIFFDLVDNHTCVHSHMKKNFKIFHFLAKFFNYLKGPQTEYFLSYDFWLPNMNGQCGKTQFFWSWKLGFVLILVELCVVDTYLATLPIHGQKAGGTLENHFTLNEMMLGNFKMKAQDWSESIIVIFF